VSEQVAGTLLTRREDNMRVSACLHDIPSHKHASAEEDMGELKNNDTVRAIGLPI